MSLSNNLRVLRKKKGLSQEQLAEQLNVSRQAVSKWEGDQGYPEMDKIIQLSELFNCTIDQLLKENIEETNVEIKQLYELHHKNMITLATIGIALILAGFCMFLLFELLLSGLSDQMYLGEVAFMLCVTLGVICFIFYGLKTEAFNKKYEGLVVDFYTQAEVDAFQKHFTLAVASGVGIILFGVILQILLEGAFNSELANFVFMVCVSVAVCIFVYFGLQKDKLEKQDKTISDIKKEKDTEMLTGIVCGCIMLVATINYFIWSFIFDGWNISWIVFPVGGAICGIAVLIIQLKHHNK